MSTGDLNSGSKCPGKYLESTKTPERKIEIREKKAWRKGTGGVLPLQGDR